MVQSSHLRKTYLSTFQQAMPLKVPTPASLLGLHKARAFTAQNHFGGHHYSFSYHEPSEDGAAAGYLRLPDGSDITERMCNVYEHFFSSPQGDFNSSCLFFVVRLEKAFHYCTENTVTTPPPGTEDADDEDAGGGFWSNSAVREEVKEDHFSNCIEKERPQWEPEEICRDLYNASAANQTDAPGGEPFTQCFKDADLVQICFGNCGGAEHSRYSFLECIGDCYHFNITEEAKTPVPEPTTPPIPPPLVPIVGHMWNASVHLDHLHGNLRNISKVSHNVTSQWEERFPNKPLPTTMPPPLVGNDTETNDTAPVAGIGLLTRIRRGLHSMVSAVESGR